MTTTDRIILKLLEMSIAKERLDRQIIEARKNAERIRLNTMLALDTLKKTKSFDEESEMMFI